MSLSRPADAAGTPQARGRFSAAAAVAVPLAVTALVAVLVAGCGGTSGGNAAGAGGSAGAGAGGQHTAAPAAPADPGASPSGSAAPQHTPRTTGPGGFIPVPPGHAAQPQTRAFPAAHSRAFRDEMTDLWASVVTGRPTLGMPAFFPLAAYRQVKAIADPTADWHGRLVADFRLDVAAAHRLLAGAARQDRLIRVIVPSAEAAWITPGVCYNGAGYWHVAGARVVYRQRGQVRSFGIASLISWRGRWYVVHFGAVLRPAAGGGVVDEPAAGPGIPGPPGGC